MGCCVSTDEVFDYDGELKASGKGKQRSVEVLKGEEGKDCSPIRRHPSAVNGLVTAPFEGKSDQDRCATIWYAFQRGVSVAGKRPCLGRRATDPKTKLGTGDYTWMTYEEVDRETRYVGLGLRKLGVQKGQTVGICSANTPEWTMTALGNYSQGMVTVALYDTLGADAVEYIINHAEVQVAVCGKKNLKDIKTVMRKCPSLKAIVMQDRHAVFQTGEPVDEKDREDVRAAGKELYGYSELVEMGKREAGGDFPQLSSDDLAFIMYTSGTTGVPKGAMLTHGNVMACVAGVMKGGVKLTAEDSHISYLPLAHIFETAVQAAMNCVGAAIGFFCGDVKGLTEDIKALKPTLMAGVPRVFTRIYQAMTKRFEELGGIKMCVILNNLTSQKKRARRGQPFDPTIEKRFLDVRSRLGLERCRIIVTGAAPMPPYLLEFLRVVINPKDGVLQGYGMTETSAAVSLTEWDDHTMGHVGPPLPSAEIKLRDVPEMGYLHTDPMPRGEVLARGPSIFRGYYKNEKATNETLEGGWIATGDVGRWNPNGTLSIIDRKKNIFKISLGEYIAAEHIEGIYGKSKMIAQIFIYGNSYKPFIVAVVVPSADGVGGFLKEKGWLQTTEPMLSEGWRAAFKQAVIDHNADVVKAIVDSAEPLVKDAKLKPFELPKDLLLEPTLDGTGQGFTVENECMTPTFKIRRPFLVQRYSAGIKELYAKHGEPAKPDENWV